MSKSTRAKKAKMVSFRIDDNLFARYEMRCIEEQIFMSEILREAIENFVCDSCGEKLNLQD